MKTETDPTANLKKLYIALKQTQAKLEAMESAAREPIAIIGMGCRFPGGANSPQKYWELLLQGKDAITDAPPDRWSGKVWLDLDPDAPGKMFTTKGGFLDHPVDMFDAQFFNISPKEATGLDPQQRLLLEVSRETFENAGIAPSSLKGASCGVFLGMSSDDYALAHRHSGNHKMIDAYSITGTTFSTACGRISYVYGLEGPSITVDTACSSALGAIHLACKSLRTKESDLALVGGVNLMLSPESHICFSKLRAISPDGHCKSFSADANGYVRGEGCGLVLLKRLSEAILDNNRIIAVIRGSAMNQDGKSNGFTAPSGPAQEKVILAALKDADLTPIDVGFIETHGTGTPLGDPIEAEAIGAVFEPYFSSNLATKKDSINIERRLIIGSCKTNIGHLEPASGIAALIKAALCVHHGKIPPNLHFSNPNPFIQWDTTPIEVPTQTLDWSSDERVRIAGVNAFGFSGTNVHVIVSQAQAPTIKNSGQSHHILPISAKTESSAKHLQEKYINFLEQNDSSANASDICKTASQGRDHFEYRIASVGSDNLALSKALRTQSFTRADGAKQPLTFLFTGQGSQYHGMGRTLFQTQPTFRRTLEQCSEILTPMIGESLISMLYDEDGDQDRLHQTRYTQPALFAIEYALYKLWSSLGIKPDFMMGHSVGEYVAACAAGLFSLEDGLKLISRRGELMQSLPSGGGMAAIMASKDEVEAAILSYPNTLSIAAFNGPMHTVVSGVETDLMAVIKPFKDRGVKVVNLTVSHAFHSPLIEPILDDFEKSAASILFQTPKTRLISNVSGDIAGNEIMTPNYWREHIRKPVKFMQSLLTLKRENVNIFMEMGPKPTLLGMGRTALSDTEGLWLPSLRVGQTDWEVMLTSLAKLYTNGFDPNFSELYLSKDGEQVGQTVDLPTYQFDKRRFWLPIESSIRTSSDVSSQSDLLSDIASKRLYPLIDRKISSPLISSTLFETQFNLASLPFLDDHRIFNRIVVSAASHLSLLSGAASLIFHQKGCIIEDILFTQALVIPEAFGRTVQLLFSPIEPNAQHDFTIISFDQNANKKRQSEANYIGHVTGRIAPLASASDALLDHEIGKIEQSSKEIARAWSECKNVMNPNDVYLFQDKRQIKLGESYRWIGAIQSGVDKAICRFKPPKAINMEEWGLHPGLIDSCFGLMVTAAGGDPDATYIPFAIEEFRYYRQPDSTTMEAVATIRRESTNLDNRYSLDKLLGDITLYDKDGVVAKWIGLEGRQVDPFALLKDQIDSGSSDITGDLSVRSTVVDEASEFKNWLYEIAWELYQPPSIRQFKEDSTINQTGQSNVAKWLILSDNKDGATALSEAINATTGDLCRLILWDNLTIYSESLRKDILDALEQSRLKGIIHLITDNESSKTDSKQYEEIEATQQKICGLTLELVQAAIQSSQSSNDKVKLILITCGTQSVTGKEVTINPHASTLWGMGRVIALEHPELNCTLVDLDPDRDAVEQISQAMPILSLANGKDENLSSYNSENQIALRQGKYYVARLKRVNSALTSSKSAKQEDIRSLKISQKNSYLITGGLGGLGLIMARWLAKKGAGTIILVGRKEPSPSAINAVEEIRKLGTCVEIRSVDLTQTEQIKSLLADISKNLPQLKGVIHAAGILDDGMLLQLNWSKFWGVMAPKVMGAYILDQQTKEMNLDFFILFSSIVSILGTPAQSNYAAANAFLDGVCRNRHIFNRQNSSNEIALSINWGPFDQAGMAARLDEINRRRITAQGFKLISPESGVRALEWLLNQDVSQMTVMDLDWSKFMERLQSSASVLESQISTPLFLTAFQKSTAASKQPTGAAGSWQEELNMAPAHEYRQLLLNRLRGATANILGLDTPDELHIDGRLFDLGLDSLMAVELKNCVEKNLNCRLKSTLVFDYPTVASMAEYLTETLNLTKSEKNSKEQAASSVVTPKTQIVQKRLEQSESKIQTRSKTPDIALADMSDDDAEEMLRRELENLLGGDL
ncbi:MAG: SDR family NAD(P)-dependent oxidoreductase [Desulfamplus sp.]|nr:SDR family NAD(P)-dependent oxidoreductase [Desulfamplus sp.]